MATQTLTQQVVNTDLVIRKTEKYDAEIMEVIRNDKDFAHKYLRNLGEYHKGRKSSSYKEVIYEFPESHRQHQVGRLYVRQMSGLQGFPFDIRNPLLCRYNWDIDMENAHYWLMVKLAKDWGNLPTPAIQHYIDHRDEELAKVCENRRNAKTLFLKALYGGNIKLYHEFYEDESEQPKGDLALLNRIKSEIVAIADMCWGKFSHLRKLTKKTNPKYSLLALVLQTEERKCLLALDEYMKSVGRTVSVYIHDGCAIEKANEEEAFPEEHLRGAEAYVLNNTGHNIHLIAKSFKHDYAVKKDDSLIDPNITISDSWAASRFAEQMGNRLVLDSGHVWVFSRDTGIWSSDVSDLKRAITKQNGKLIFKQQGALGIKTYDYSGSVSRTNALIEKLPSVLEKQNGYFQSRITSDIGKILFPDGIYDFKTGEFSTEFDQNIVFHYAMPFRFPKRDEERIALVRVRLFGVGKGDEPFEHQEDADTLRHTLMRAAIGDFLRKMALLGDGWGNSGKGATDVAFSTAFGDYVGHFGGNSLLAKGYDGEDARENTFTLAFINRRFAFSSEIKLMKDAAKRQPVRIDANKFKLITSGGTDPIKARPLYGNEVSLINKATVIMFAQGFPEFEPPDDAMKNRIRSVKWSHAYVNEPTEAHERKMDRGRVDFFREQASAEALFWVMVDTYDEWAKGGHVEPPLSQREKEASQDLVPQFNFKEVFEEAYEITGKTGVNGDSVAYEDIKKHMEARGYEGGKMDLCRRLDAFGLKAGQKKVGKKNTQVRWGVREAVGE